MKVSTTTGRRRFTPSGTWFSASGFSAFGFSALGFSALGAAVLLLLLASCSQKSPEISKSNTSLIEARQALEAGDKAKAIELLNASIAERPNTWALFELAKLQLDGGDEKAALASCDKALELDPESGDVLWLKGEINKPEASRFKGRFKNPPSANK